MGNGKSLREVKAEKTARKKRALRRRRVTVLLIEILILIVLLGIGYVMSNYEVIQQMEWFQNLSGAVS